MKLGKISRTLRESTLSRNKKFHTSLIKHTNNFGDIKWLGNPIWQNVQDLWTLQETIADIQPSLLIETGTNRGGSSLFYAHLYDLMDCPGEIITVDIEKMHDLSHPRITHLIGSSTSDEIVEQIRQRVAATTGDVMVILDSFHRKYHVAAEMEAYAGCVTSGSYLMVQDGIIDELPMMTAARPGPLTAIEEFLKTHDEFELDKERCERFLITHHPKGWLRRK